VEKDLLYKVAYEEAVRALTEQHAVIESFRNRAGLLFSAAAITTSFLGAQALRGGESPLVAWLAFIAFGAVAALSLALLWPYVWQTTMNPHEIVAIYIESEHPAAIDSLHRELLHYMHASYLQNQEGLNLLAVLFQVASGLLVLEIALWIVAIAITS
jgi:hypothetical protein